MKHRCDIWRVAEQCGVRLVDPDAHAWRQRRPRECYAKKTLKKIGQRHGEAHLALTLRLIVETYENAAELYSETIQAVSSLVANPAIEARGGALFEQFDRISLAEIRHQARQLALGLPLAHVMRVLLAVRLADGIVAGDRRAA
ncbi:hypothetical protein [Mesorhizobium sp. B2-6-1]|uniref:hypothetical protein n=1 Tax=Mesorhizobium sp. B2-6-1 TaxID=2589916 RepID=UPI001128FCC8|nr:hypothetical protein [Mesorhizobium sp. B2-6-1]TPJ60840.1 hypothetical protein FJ443_20070 [Mesorhizobium sp. B2-6-1]